jgi:hypothetical protein
MSARLIAGVLALLSSGCIVTSSDLTRGQFDAQSSRRQSSPHVQHLPAHSARIAEVVLTTDGTSVRRRHLAARVDHTGWRSRLSETLQSPKRSEIPLEAPAAFLVRGLPLEVARWLALTEYHWQVGGRGHTVKHRSVERGYTESNDRGLQNQAIRQVVRFQLGKDTICASQRKIYGEIVDAPLPPATDLVTAYRRSQRLDPEAPFGVESVPLRGQIVLQVFELQGELIRVEVHHGLARSTTPGGEAVDTILVCSMPKGTRSADLGQFRFAQTAQGLAALFRPSQAIAWAE